jgi:hypothetical protein
VTLEMMLLASEGLELSVVEVSKERRHRVIGMTRMRRRLSFIL